jgi:hypothetical protein
MKSGLAARAAFAVQTHMLSDLFESSLHHVDRYPLRGPSDKEKIIRFPGWRTVTTGVLGKDPNRVRSEGNETAFEELRVSDRKDGCGKINIAYRQR